MKPTRVIRLSKDAFCDATSVCEGRQIAALVAVVSEVVPDLEWYVADVPAHGPAFVAKRSPVPQHVGDSQAMMAAALTVDQFASGVLAGVPRDQAEPCFREGGLWTEDEELGDLGDSIVEIRAFDTSYVLLATTSDAIADSVAAAATRGLRF